MFSSDEQHKSKSDVEDVFEVTFATDAKSKSKSPKQTDTRQSQKELKQKVSVYKQCSSLFSFLKDSQIKQDEVIVQLPEQLQAKYIIKSISYLADEWVTLRTSFIKQGDSQHKLLILLDYIEEDQIANLCAELNECIDHFIARATED